MSSLTKIIDSLFKRIDLNYIESEVEKINSVFNGSNFVLSEINATSLLYTNGTYSIKILKSMGKYFVSITNLHSFDSTICEVRYSESEIILDLLNKMEPLRLIPFYIEKLKSDFPRESFNFKKISDNSLQCSGLRYNLVIFFDTLKYSKKFSTKFRLEDIVNKRFFIFSEYEELYSCIN